MASIMEKATNKLLENKPFFAHFLLNSCITYDRKDVPTACVSVRKDTVEFCFNREYMESIGVDLAASVIEHEVYHVMFLHCQVDRKTFTNHRALNVAMDCAINQFIDKVAEDWITLPLLEKITGKKLEPFQTWKYYYQELMDYVDSLPKNQDEHSEGVGTEADAAAGVVQGVADQSAKAARGNVPEHIIKQLQALNSAPQHAWQSILSNFVASAVSSIVRHTRARVNRRYGLAQPGRRRKRELVLGVAVDSSGSVSDEAFASFLTEIQRISSLCAKVYLVDADCVVHSVQEVTKKKKLNLRREGGGGTAYQPAIDECMRRDVDAIIYFGDFDTADQPKDPGVPFLWVGVGSSPKPAAFGSELRLK